MPAVNRPWRARPGAWAGLVRGWAVSMVLTLPMTLSLSLLAGGPAAAAEPRPAAKPRAEPRLVEGRVTRVTDGDSLWLQPAAPGAAHLVVRLQNIDAPEICQTWGPQARDALAEMVLGKAVTLRLAGMDDYGRTLGQLTQDEVKVNVRMVEEGHAWSTRDKWDRGPYVKQERMAKALSRGLHGAGGAVLPKVFRRDHGPCPR